jgi:hypothetical protein
MSHWLLLQLILGRSLYEYRAGRFRPVVRVIFELLNSDTDVKPLLVTIDAEVRPVYSCSLKLF